MCTVTWIQEEDHYSLFCNRDELRTRQPALPPHAHQNNRVRFLAPADGDVGGTWIAVNEFGLSLCLLNDYSATIPDPAADFSSRGHLVRDLIRAVDVGALETLWSDIDLATFRPCKILALAPAKEPRLFEWNGQSSIRRGDGIGPLLCSSSFDGPGANRARTDLLAELSTRADLDPRKRHLRFHQSHQPERGPYSVCMHRPDAATVSFTIVEVDPAAVSMAYAQGAPCSTPLEHLVTLERSN